MTTEREQPRWLEYRDRGLITICEPVLAETLKTVETKRYAAAEVDLRENYVVAGVPERVWDMVAAIRRDLAAKSAHQGPSLADLVIAATAIQLKLEVLREDHDFETISRHVPQLQQRRISTTPEA